MISSVDVAMMVKIDADFDRIMIRGSSVCAAVSVRKRRDNLATQETTPHTAGTRKLRTLAEPSTAIRSSYISL